MTKQTEKLVEYALDGKPEQMREGITKIIAERAVDALEARKMYVARNLFLGGK